MILQHPFTCIIAGPTCSGKTFLVRSLINEDCIQPSPKEIIWLYAEDQPLHKTLQKTVKFHKGIPENSEGIINGKSPTLIVIDDLMTELHSDQRLTRIFTVGSHHRNLTVIFIVQNLSHQGKEMRNLSLNSHYLVLFKNPRDRHQISVLARQMYPGNTKFLLEAYNDATKQAFGYLLLDLKPSTEDDLRVRTGILSRDPPVVYIPQTIISKS